MKQCRICEYKFKIKAPIDGLCPRCHMALCQKGLGKCVRCAKLIDNMIGFLSPEEDEENDQS